jgi:toxin FitB
MTNVRWGRVMARGQAAGRPVTAMDACIAATAERHDLTLVTRNVADFEVLGIRLINPWRDA